MGINLKSGLQLFFVFFTGCMSVNVYSHHSFAAEFDAATQGELTGKIVEVRFSNPHVRYRIEVPGAGGKQEVWELQASSVTQLRSQNWNQDTIKLGDVVTVSGQLGRDGVKKLFVRGVTLASGQGFGTAATRDERREPNQVYADVYQDYGHGQVNSDHPFDISGPWRNTYKFRVTVDDLLPKPTPFTEQGRLRREEFQKYDDPGLRCIALGLPRVFGGPYNMDIYDAGDHYLFIYVQDNTVRRIWMDERIVPADTRPTSLGYSVGHWQDASILIIETTHLLSGLLDGSGLPMSGEGTRTVERYDFAEDHLSAERSMTIYDPFYTQPLVRTRGMAREADLDVSEQDSCDPASYYVDLYEADLLEHYLKP